MRKVVLAKFVDQVSTRFSNDYKDVFVNPDKKEVKECCDRSRVCRAMVVDKNTVYVFPESLLHYRVWEHFKLKDAVGLVLYFAGSRELVLSVTDVTKRGKWHHNPKVAEYLRSNAWLSKFDISDIDYYDSDIEGDWAETFGE
jgi:hypothetical protein